MSTLRQVSDEHRRLLAEHIDGYPALASALEDASDSECAARLATEHDFLVATLIPTMATIEATFYPELDRLLSCRLAMTPMAREHETMRLLVIRLGEIRGDCACGMADRAEAAAVLRRLHALTMPHLREESHYVPILDRYLDEGRAASLATAIDAGSAPANHA